MTLECWLSAVFGAALVGVLAHFGYRYYVSLVEAETEKHARRNSGH